MAQVDSSNRFGEICEPHGDSLLSKISACLVVGMEAVLVPEREGVVCTAPKKGGVYLDTPVTGGSDEPRYPNPHKIDPSLVCNEQKNASPPDKRRAPSTLVKDLVRAAKDRIDPQGIRIIGGVYCDGLDLSGLNIPYSLILDRSVFNGDVDIRNFRSSGDLSLDNVVSFKRLGVSRTAISGSLWGQVAFFKRLEIENSSIDGSVRLNGSIVASTLTIDSVAIGGDLDVSASYFSNLEILKNNIAHVLDLGQSQARCSYDIRKNEIGDVVAVQLGFGEIEPVEKDAVEEKSEDGADAEIEETPSRIRHEHFTFKPVTNDANFGRPIRGLPVDPYDRYAEPPFGTGAILRRMNKCVSPRSIRQGAFVLIDNNIKSSLCIRSFNWPTDPQGRTRKGNIYLNEAVVGGGTWLNLTRQANGQSAAISDAAPEADRAQGAEAPELNIFNVTTGTLVLNFGLTEQDIALKVNGLHFKRIYASQEPCEAALSLRAGKPRPQPSVMAQQPTFPPVLELPTAEQVTTWINKNQFARTQQPFAEFVGVFERAGNSEVATDLKIKAANFALWSSSCSLLPDRLERAFGWCAQEDGANGNGGARPGASVETASWFERAARWLEQAFVAIFQFLLGILADYGYRPERIIWWVIGTVAVAWVFFRYVLRIVAFGVEGAPERIRPVGLVFLFDRLLPAYRIREEHYRIGRFFRASDSPEPGREIKCFNRRYKIVEAPPRLQEWVELALDGLKFIGFVFAIFVVAAIGRLVH